MNDRISELEQRLSLVESELITTKAKLERQRIGARISAWAVRATWMVGFAMATATATHGDGKLPPAALTVKAPFTVVDSKGKDLFRVYESEASVRIAATCNAQGTPVSLLRTQGENGSLKLLGGDSTSFVETGFDKGTNSPNLLLIPKDKIAAEISMRSMGHMALRISNPAGKQVVGLGDAGASGALSINDAEGGVLASIQGIGNIGQVAIAASGKADIRAKMGESDGKLGFFVYNGAKQNVARLSEAPNSYGGYMAIGDSKGVPLVDAGTVNGVGIVRAGPMSRAMVGGFPGSFIEGKP